LVKLPTNLHRLCPPSSRRNTEKNRLYRAINNRSVICSLYIYAGFRQSLWQRELTKHTVDLVLLLYRITIGVGKGLESLKASLRRGQDAGCHPVLLGVRPSPRICASPHAKLTIPSPRLFASPRSSPGSDFPTHTL
jgi:hypothetical protein